jgi:hypothetical protein
MVIPPSCLLSRWFAPEERTLATSLACLPGVMGPAIGFLISLAVSSASHVPALLIAELVVSVISVQCKAST